MSFSLRQILSMSVATAMIFSATAVSAAELPQASSDWYKDADSVLQKMIAEQPNLGKAKNVILFVADGNGVTSVTATRIFDGQKKGMSGEENMLSYETFPNLAMSKTYNSNAQTPDSAGTATAMVAGVKTRQGVLSVDESLERGDCNGTAKASVKTIAEMAQEKGYAVGIVSTARVTHATPGSVLAHSADRNFEDNSKLPEGCTGQKDIAQQLIEAKPDVLLGGGRRHFIPKEVKDEEGKKGKRTDGKNLIEEWVKAGGQYAYDDKTHAKLDPKGGPILGLYESSHMKYEADRANEPSLADLTKTAVETLQTKSNGKGFWLMVESGRVDHAHHEGNAYRALTDGVAFADAVKIADEMTKDEDTLIIVTADHSHVMVLNGYAKRGNNILGLCRELDKKGNPTDKLCKGLDDKPYTTIGYYNGAASVLKKDEKGNYTAPEGRETLTDEIVLDPDFQQQTMLPRKSETHSGEDVAIYAKGPWAHLVRGTVEQNYIFHVMKKAMDF